MRLVEWIDNNGYKHKSWVKDTDPDRAAPGGLPADPPDLDALDWDGCKRELHNALVDRNLTDWPAIQRAGDSGLTSAILAVFKKQLINLYRQQGVDNG